MEFSRQEYWSGWPFPSPGDLPDLWIELVSATLQADSLLSEPPGKPKCNVKCYVSCWIWVASLSFLFWNFMEFFFKYFPSFDWIHGYADTKGWLFSSLQISNSHFSLSCTGEGNGNPLQCSCLENPRDGGAWWAAVYGVAQSRARLKRLSSSSRSSKYISYSFKLNPQFFILIDFVLTCHVTYCYESLDVASNQRKLHMVTLCIKGVNT